MLTGWFQHADFLSEDLESTDINSVIESFNHFDWKKEIAFCEEKQCNGELYAPPGIGLVLNGETILHICAENEVTFFVNFHYREKVKILKFIPWTFSRIFYKENLSKTECRNLIELLHENKLDAIKEILADS